MSTRVSPFKLRVLRKQRGFSQKQLAEAIGVHTNAVHMWEKSTHHPTPWNVMAICRVLDCTTDELVEEQPATSAGRKRGRRSRGGSAGGVTSRGGSRGSR